VRWRARSRRVDGCACALGGHAGAQRLKGGLDVCEGDGSHAFGRPVRPSAQIVEDRRGKGGSKEGYEIIGHGKGRTFAKHSNAKRDAACGSSALSGMCRGFLECVPSTS
jgi:hypothetical protein